MKAQKELSLPACSNNFSGDLPEHVIESMSTGVAICYFEKGYPLYYLNDRLLNYLGYTKQEFSDATFGYMLNAIHPDDRRFVEQTVTDALSIGDDSMAEFRIIKKDGSTAWFHVTGKRSVTDDGRQLIINICFTISEGTFLKRQSDLKNRGINELINNLACGICKISLDDSLSIIYANTSFYDLYGYTQKQAAEAGFNKTRFIIYPADFSKVRLSINEFISNHQYSFELEHRSKHISGKMVWMLARCSYNPNEPLCLNCVLIDITDRKEMEDHLRISDEVNRIALEQTDKLIAILDIATRTLRHPPKAEELFGLSSVVANVPYSIVESGLVAEENVTEYTRFYENILNGTEYGSCVIRMRCKSGIYKWFRLKSSLVFDKNHKPQRGVISYEDVTDQREKELAFKKWSQYFDSQQTGSIGYYEFNLTKDLFEGSKGCLFEKIPDNLHTFTDASRYAAYHFVCEEDREAYLNVLNRETLLKKYEGGNGELKLEHRRKGPDGSFYWASGMIQLVPDPYTDDVKAFVLIKNIDRDKKKTMELQKLSERDALTGLFNRRTVMKRVSDILQNSSNTPCHAFIMMDIDNFKLLNDTFGHQFGDQVLQDLADGIKSVLNTEDCCGRLGGDEFIIFLNHLRSEQDMLERLERFIKVFTKDYDIGAHITLSIGVSKFPLDGNCFDILYNKADVALYEAKRLGRNRYVIYRNDIV